MKRVRRILVLLVGLAAFLCTVPAFAAEENPIIIPYAVHYGDWWSGLNLFNGAFRDVDVEIYYNLESMLAVAPYGSRLVLAGAFPLKARTSITKLLPDFFTKSSFPDEYSPFWGNQQGRVSLIIKTTDPVLNSFLRATLFTGKSGPGGGFSFQVFRAHRNLRPY